ncbi:unnamed protein product [Ectocarpus sp. 12 AP-2014]
MNRGRTQVRTLSLSVFPSLSIGPALGTPTVCPLQTLPIGSCIQVLQTRVHQGEHTPKQHDTTKSRKNEDKKPQACGKNCVKNSQHADCNKAGIRRSISTADAYNETMGP